MSHRGGRLSIGIGLAGVAALVGPGIVGVPGVATAGPAGVAVAEPHPPVATPVTTMLNRRLRPTREGVLVRAPDRTTNRLAPTSWLRNDLHPPTTMWVDNLYCSGGAPTPSSWDGYQYLTWLNSPRTNGRTITRCLPYLGRDANREAAVGDVAVGVAGSQIAARYPADAGSVVRCTTVNTSGCPSADGNPTNILNSSGRGCYPGQVRSKGRGRATFVGGDCQCPVGMSGRDWTTQLLRFARPESPYGYFRDNRRDVPYYERGGRVGKAPMLVLANTSACWANSWRQLAGIQNSLWHRRLEWWNGRVPEVPSWAQQPLTGSRAVTAMKYYTGWNEVLTRRSAFYDQVAATVIKLPAGVSRIADLPQWAISRLGQTLAVTAQGPTGSTQPVVVLTERYVGRDRWRRHFQAESFDFLPFGADIRLTCRTECRLG